MYGHVNHARTRLAVALIGRGELDAGISLLRKAEWLGGV